MGNLQLAVVHAANLPDGEGGELVLRGAVGQFPRLELVLADGGYNHCGLAAWVQEQLGVPLAISSRPAGTKGFVVEPRRWVVEQTIAVLNRNRRLSKDYEYVNRCSESYLLIASINRSLQRLAPV